MKTDRSSCSRAFHSSLLTLLRVAISGTVCVSSAQAANDWVPTRTTAFLVPTVSTGAPRGTVNPLMASAVAKSSYTMKLKGTPKLTNTRVTALEISQPIRVTVALKTHNTSQLDELVRSVIQPGSANYQKYITPVEFKRQFAPTDAEVGAVVAHLKSSGFSNIQVSPGNRAVTALGNANTVQTAFRTSLKRFTYDGRPVYANDSDVSVPASLGTVVDAVLGLQNAARPKRLSYRVAADAVTKDSTSSDAAGSQIVHDVTDFAKIYGASRLPAATGTTVGIITWGDLRQTIADLKTFTTLSGLPPVDTLVVPGGAGILADDGNPSEWNLDSQTIVATSGGVKQLIFYSAINGDANDSELTEGTLVEAMFKAITDNVAKIINVSLSIDETAENAAGVQAVTDELFKQAAVQGQIFSVASGDSGVYQAFDSPQGTPGTIGTFDGVTVTPTVDLTQLSVAWPANSPYVVTVGGTTLSTIDSTKWAGETVWNDGLFFADSNAQGQPANNFVRLLATGGGVSQFEPAPAWQTLALGRAVTKRVLPDISFSASLKSGARIIVNGKPEVHAGTSLASPIFVGGFARIETAQGNSIGLPTPWIYRNLAHHHSTFHDVTSGNNGFRGSGFTASAGWDNATGFGSLDFGKLNKVLTPNAGEPL